MTQKSYPWGRSLGADSMVGYTAKEWYSIWGAMAKAGAVVVDGGITSDPLTYNLGVFYSIDGQLEVTTPGNARIDVDTGAALVEGAFFENDTAIGAGGDVNVGPASLLVVVRKNYSAVAYVPAVASAALFTVPAYTARVTVIDAASFQQDTNRLAYWDIPLASFDINAGGVISNWVDLREYADAEDKILFVQCNGIRNDTDAIPVERLSSYGYEMLTAKLYYAFGDFAVPTDYISGMTASALFRTVAAGPGDIYCRNMSQHGECDELWNAKPTDDTGDIAVAVTAAPSTNNCIATIDVIAPTIIGDIVTLSFTRDATNMLDTYTTGAFVGWKVTYFGWR